MCLSEKELISEKEFIKVCFNAIGEHVRVSEWVSEWVCVYVHAIPFRDHLNAAICAGSFCYVSTFVIIKCPGQIIHWLSDVLFANPLQKSNDHKSIHRIKWVAVKRMRLRCSQLAANLAIKFIGYTNWLVPSTFCLSSYYMIISAIVSPVFLKLGEQG